MIALERVSARGVAERWGRRPALASVTIEHRVGVLAVLGTPADGAALLLDVLDGTAPPASGRATVLGEAPALARARVSRVSREAPLPDALRVREACDLAAELRGEDAVPARDRLASIGVEALADRHVRSLDAAERRAVALAIAVTSTRSEVLLVDEPLLALPAVAPRLVVDALRRRAASTCIVVTTASVRDAARLGDRLAVLTAGVLRPVPPDAELPSLHPRPGGYASMRVVVSPAQGKRGAAALAGLLAADAAIARVETIPYGADASTAHAVSVTGPEHLAMARAVTRAIAAASVDVDLVEPSMPTLDALRAALAWRDALPPPSAPASAPPPAAEPPASGAAPEDGQGGPA